MAKKTESDPEQYKRFLQKVKDMEDAGELSPTEAEKEMERVLGNIARSDNDEKSS